jgi:hypothetical protein
MTTTLQVLDRALGALRDLGLVPEKTEEAPIVALLNQISQLGEDKVVAIARTLSQASLFNEVVREQIGGMELGERYEKITDAFNSIRDDARAMVQQLEDGNVDTLERLANLWMKVTRGDIPSRFAGIKKTYLEVAEDSVDQIRREQLILNAYMDFRIALKECEILAVQLLKQARAKLEDAKRALQSAAGELDRADRGDPEGVARRELARDQSLRALQDEEKRYQITKDLSDNLTVSYHTTEVVMARLQQTTNAKERVYAQATSFFGTNETVLTALSASFAGLHGLHESTRTLEAMKHGISQSLETLGEVGAEVQEAALRAGYGPSIRAESVKKLVESVVGYQERSRAIIEEMRAHSTRNAEEIREAVEEGKRRMTALLQSGAA